MCQPLLFRFGWGLLLWTGSKISEAHPSKLSNGNREAEKATACGRCLAFAWFVLTKMFVIDKGKRREGVVWMVAWVVCQMSYGEILKWTLKSTFSHLPCKSEESLILASPSWIYSQNVDWGCSHSRYKTVSVKFQNTDQGRSIHVEKKTPLSPHTSGIGMLCRTWLASDLSICVLYVLVRKLHINRRFFEVCCVKSVWLLLMAGWISTCCWHVIFLRLKDALDQKQPPSILDSMTVGKVALNTHVLCKGCRIVLGLVGGWLGLFFSR